LLVNTQRRIVASGFAEMETCAEIKELTISYTTQEDENEKFTILVSFFKYIPFLYISKLT